MINVLRSEVGVGVNAGVSVLMIGAKMSVVFVGSIAGAVFVGIPPMGVGV